MYILILTLNFAAINLIFIVYCIRRYVIYLIELTNGSSVQYRVNPHTQIFASKDLSEVDILWVDIILCSYNLFIILVGTDQLILSFDVILIKYNLFIEFYRN